MKAVVRERYGAPQDVLRLADVGEPVVGDDDVLVDVRATSVNAADWHMLRGVPYVARLDMGVRAPKVTILGCDVAGQVEAVGRNVTRFRPGDEVFGCPYADGFGAFAERVSVAEGLLAAPPASLAFEQAAAVPLAAITALQALRDRGQLESGQKALIVGASGGVGTFAVQIAKSLGAEVTGVCSTRNVDMVRSLGADHVVDYTREDFTARGERYDLILQVAGTLSPSRCRRALTAKGTLVLISGDGNGRWVGPIGRMARAAALSPVVSQRLVVLAVKPTGEDLQAVKELVEAGKLAPVIDRTYALAEVPEAIRYLEDDHARGKVVVTVPPA